MQKIYIKFNLLFFFCLITYNNTLISMHYNTTAVSTSQQQKVFYYNLNPQIQKQSFQCNMCDKLCKTQRCFNIHQKSHSKQIYFFCNYLGCEKKYLSQSALNKHRQIQHTSDAEKIYHCMFCTQKFAMPYLLNEHIKNKH
jgi:hypothetical protein